MALSAADRAIVETWAGPVDDPADVEERIARLGRAEAAALELLQARLTARQTGALRAGLSGDADVTLTSPEQLRGMQGNVARLAGLCAGLNGLTPAGRSLVALCLQAAASGLVAAAYEVDNRRPG